MNDFNRNEIIRRWYEGQSMRGIAVDLHLAPDALARLDTIFPGPGGAAPEAYAW